MKSSRNKLQSKVTIRWCPPCSIVLYALGERPPPGCEAALPLHVKAFRPQACMRNLTGLPPHVIPPRCSHTGRLCAGKPLSLRRARLHFHTSILPSLKLLQRWSMQRRDLSKHISSPARPAHNTFSDEFCLNPCAPATIARTLGRKPDSQPRFQNGPPRFKGG